MTTTSNRMRTLAFIENDMYVRNFITSGAFDRLIAHGDFAFCLSSFVQKLKPTIPAQKIAGTYDRSDENIRVVAFMNKLAVRAMRSKSTTFDIKVKAGWPFGRYGLRDWPLSVTPVFKYFSKPILTRMLTTNPSVEKLIAQHRPRLVIFPVTGVESTGSELIMLSRKYGFKTLFLVNGWDNLSSKGVFAMLPDYLGVWGPQSAGDAERIQGMPSSGIVMMGCARYEDYFVRANADAQIFAHKYILFAGATTPNDEITPLRVFEEVLENTRITDIKVVYRPHPWRDKRNCFDLFEEEKYKHVILDPQVADAYYGEKRRASESSSALNFPALKYYPSLVNNALFAVSPMSSMSLEAALFDVPCMILAHDDGCHVIPGNLQAEYEHFKGGEAVPGWFFARTLEDIGPTFAKLVEELKNESPRSRRFRPALSEAMHQYLYFDERSYAERLEQATMMILSETKVEATDERSA